LLIAKGSAMKHLLFSILFFVTINLTCHAQVTMLLERPGTVKYYMYHAGDHLTIQYKKGEDGFRDAGVISEITDSTVQINELNRYKFRDITSVYRPRFFFKLFTRTALVFGAGYIALTAANQVLNSKSPIVDKNTLIIGGSSIAAAGISRLFENRKIELGENWRLRTIDLSIIKPVRQE
jgi:hypothetical protein